MSVNTKEETSNNETAEPSMSDIRSPRPCELINSRPRSSSTTLLSPVPNVTTTPNDRFHDTIFLGRLRAQVEFYFSTANLSRDLYLRSLLASYGGTAVPLTVICGFPKVRELCSCSNDLRRIISADPLLIHKAVERSSIVMTSPDAVWISPLIPLPPLDPSMTKSVKPISMNLDRRIHDVVQMRREKLSPKEEDMNPREGSERCSTTRRTVLLRDIPSHYSPELIIKSFTVNNIVPTSARPDIGNTWYVTFKKEDDAISAVSATRNQTIDGLPIKARIKSEMVLPVAKRPESSSNYNQQLSPTHTSSQNSTQSYTNSQPSAIPVPPGGHQFPIYPMSPSIPVPFTYPPTYPHLPHTTHTSHPHSNLTAGSSPGSSPGHTTYPSPPYYYTSPHVPHIPPPHIPSKSSVPNYPPYTSSPPPTVYGTYITTQPYGQGGYYGIEPNFGPPSRNSLNPFHEPQYGRTRSRNMPKRIIDPKKNSKKNKGRGGYYPTRQLSMSSNDMNPVPPFPPGTNEKTPISYNESQPLLTNVISLPDTKVPRLPCEESRTYKETRSNGSTSEHGPTYMLPEKEFEVSHSDMPIHHSYSDLSAQDSSNNYNNRIVNKTLHSFNKKNKKKTKPRREEFDGRNGSKSFLSFLTDEKEESKREKRKVLSTWNQDSFPALFSTKTKETDTITTSISTKFTGYADALRQTHLPLTSPRHVSIVEATSSFHYRKSTNNDKNRHLCVTDDQTLEEIIPILNSLEVDKSNPSTNESLLDKPALNVELKKSNSSGYLPKCVEKNNMISSSQVSVSLPRDNSHSNDKTFVLTKDPNLMYHAKTTPTNLSAVESFDVPSISKNSSFQKLSFSDAVRKQT